MDSLKIVVDADACPKTVLQICKKLAAENNYQLWTVANFNHQIDSPNHIVVGGDSQEADLRIVNLCAPGDIVVTQDWGLAALVLGKGAAAISPKGRIFRNETIDFLLEEREIKAKLRRSGRRTKGPHKRTNQDDLRFAAALMGLINEMKNKNALD